MAFQANGTHVAIQLRRRPVRLDSVVLKNAGRRTLHPYDGKPPADLMKEGLPYGSEVDRIDEIEMNDTPVLDVKGNKTSSPPLLPKPRGMRPLRSP
jgi:hypothetical protein